MTPKIFTIRTYIQCMYLWMSMISYCYVAIPGLQKSTVSYRCDFGDLMSIDWFKGKNTGTSMNISWENRWFPLKIFPFLSTHWWLHQIFQELAELRNPRGLRKFRDGTRRVYIPYIPYKSSGDTMIMSISMYIWWYIYIYRQSIYIYIYEIIYSIYIYTSVPYSTIL